MEGYAWSDEVIGWISFNCNNEGVCGTSDYKVIALMIITGDVTPPTVSVIAEPSSVTAIWQNSDATASISCSDTESGCHVATYRLMTHTSDPGSCSTTYEDYTLNSPRTISSHVWVCGTAKDLEGNAGFSTPVEFRVDKVPPSTAVTNPAGGSWHKNDFTATIDDSDAGGSGLAPNCEFLIVGLNPDPEGDDCSSGVLSRSCDPVDINVPVGSGSCSPSNICIFEGENRCKITTYAYDIAGNVKQASENFSIDFTPPVTGKIACTTPPGTCDPGPAIYCSAVQQGVEKTFCASTTDPVGKLYGCKLYVDGSETEAVTTISPIPCENGASCTVSANYTFDTSGSHTLKFFCWDAAGNSAFGEEITVSAEANHSPQITEGPLVEYTCDCSTPEQLCDNQFDCCLDYTTQSDCCLKFKVEATDPDGDPLTYSWNFGDGIGSSNEQNPVYHYPNPSSPTYTVSVTVSDGKGGIASENLDITVSNPTLSVDLCAGLDASVACYYGSVTFSSPANDVDLKADVSGTMYGTINYKFDCTSTDPWELEVSDQRTETYIAVDLCDYTAGYTAKVFIERGGGSDEDKVAISLIENNAPSLNWTGESGYISDGLEPETGDSSTGFNYGIEYSDPDGDAPNFVRVHIKKGGLEISGSPFNMSCPLGDYVTGVDCTFSISGLSGGLDYTYFFDAQDNQGLNALPTPEKDAPDVINPPQAQIACDATQCGVGSACNGSWVAYNRNCEFYLLNQSTDIDSTNPPDNNNDIIRSEWSIFYQDGTPWQDPYLICLDDPGTLNIDEAICDLLLPSLPAGQNYYATLYVEDTTGASDQIQSQNFYVRQEAIAEFDCSLDPDEGWQSCNGFRVSEGEVVYFRDKSSFSEGAISISNWNWTFEDGTPPSSSLQNPSASFDKVDQSSGTVTLEIIDNVGRKDITTYQLQITVPIPEWREVPPF
jgi:PKD repeat protein